MRHHVLDLARGALRLCRIMRIAGFGRCAVCGIIRKVGATGVMLCFLASPKGRPRANRGDIRSRIGHRRHRWIKVCQGTGAGRPQRVGRSESAATSDRCRPLDTLGCSIQAASNRSLDLSRPKQAGQSVQADGPGVIDGAFARNRGNARVRRSWTPNQCGGGAMRRAGKPVPAWQRRTMRR